MNSPKSTELIFFAVLCGIVFILSNQSATSTVQADTQPEIRIGGIYPTYSPVTPVPQGMHQHVEITESCDPYFGGNCIFMYAGPGVQYEQITELRNGMVFKIKSTVERDGVKWHLVHFDEWLRHADRVSGNWYIPAVSGRVVSIAGTQETSSSTRPTNKKIIIDLSDHMIYAYDGSSLFLTTKVSTGIALTPTPVGTFKVFKKMPSRYMQGPIAGVTDVPFDLPGVPWNLYFTHDGAVIHGAYWHDRYGTDQSNGCINLPPEVAKILYEWADLGTIVDVGY